MRRMLLVLLAVTAAGSLCFAGPQTEKSSAAPTTLRVEIFDRGNTPGDFLTNGKPAQWVQEAFGKPNNITVEWVPVVRAKEVEKLNIMMAAGDAPDLVFTYSSTLVSDYAKKGGLADLKEPLAKYGRNLSAFLGPGPLSYGVYSGKQYSIPGKRTITGILGSWIRKDWLDTLGMPIPTTTDQYLQTMRAFKAKDPGKVGQDKIAPVGFSRIKEIQFWNNIVYSFYKPQSEREQAGWFGLETWRCADISIPGAKEGFRFLNTLYNEGLMIKDWALAADNKAFDAAVANGYVGSFTANRIYLWQYNVIPAIRKNSPQSVWVPIDPFTNSEGKTPKLVYQPVGIFNMVPSFSKNADAVVKYMDWQATGDNLDHLMYGVEGTHFTRDSDGIVIPKPLKGDEVWEYNYGDRAVILNGPNYRDKATIYKAAGKMYVDDKYPLDVFNTHHAYLDKDGLVPPLIQSPPDSLLKLGPTVQEKAMEVIVKSIMAPAADFDRVFDAGLKEYLDVGGAQIRKDLLAAWDAQQK